MAGKWIKRRGRLKPENSISRLSLSFPLSKDRYIEQNRRPGHHEAFAAAISRGKHQHACLPAGSLINYQQVSPSLRGERLTIPSAR